MPDGRASLSSSAFISFGGPEPTCSMFGLCTSSSPTFQTVIAIDCTSSLVTVSGIIYTVDCSLEAEANLVPTANKIFRVVAYAGVNA